MKFSHKIAVAAILMVSISACKEDLDLRPTDDIIQETAFRTAADLERGLFGVYSAYGAGQFNKIYIGSILADEAKISNENRGQGQFGFKWQITPTTGEVTGDYARYYTTIDRIHRIIDAMPQVTTTTATETNQKNRIQAELLAFRGMSHYELLIRHMPHGYDASALGVPIMLASELLGKPGRNSVGDVVTQIENDLSAARGAAEIPNSVADGLRLSKAAIAAYQARVALLKRDWQAAITYATDAITLSGTSVATIEQYPAIWQDASNQEVIFRLRNNYAIQTHWRDTNGDVFFEPSDKLKAQYNRTADIRFTTFFGRVVAGTQNDTSVVTKYPGSSFGPQTNDIKDVRVSEMHLIRAEAYAETNQLQRAADEINLIRRNRISNYTNVTFASKDAAIAAIMNERFKELPYEGFRFFDLKRRGLGIERLTSDVQSTNWLTLPAGDFKFALPIPQAEIFANPNTVQNPGY
jgi:starch-binding outer membrane protein, SusD/RagB family